MVARSMQLTKGVFDDKGKLIKEDSKFDMLPVRGAFGKPKKIGSYHLKPIGR